MTDDYALGDPVEPPAGIWEEALARLSRLDDAAVGLSELIPDSFEQSDPASQEGDILALIDNDDEEADNLDGDAITALEHVVIEPTPDHDLAPGLGVPDDIGLPDDDIGGPGGQEPW
ncbi:MAG: hypothetical protein IPJ61_14790 [Tessaracoccus sp.]|uniref:hypothetical protein n=1 Tax=Tessaracoccus sp. TaxID=1971211 RepID=UPI001EB90B6E|nr:hypothetical protein [Tessaracoccus sp.]MBK7822281.1 hypothetical protein [Tessaracoccus sp.]